MSITEEIFDKYSSYKFPSYREDLFNFALDVQEARYDFEEYIDECYKYNIDKSHIKNILTSIVKDISNHKDYISFNNKVLPSLNNPFKSSNIWIPENHNKVFISIDLKKANFTVLNKVMPSVFNASTYDEFLSRYTSSNFLRKSKYFRQVIFGNLNPKRIQYLQTVITLDIAKELQKVGFIIESITPDEVILQYNTLGLVDVKTTLTNIGYNIEDFRIDVFKVIDKNYYKVKKYLNLYEDKIEIKNTPKKHYIRALCNELGIYNDLSKYFEEDGILYKIEGF